VLGEGGVGEPRIEAAPAEEVVAIVPDDAQQAFARLEQRDVEGAATQVVDQPRPVAAALGPAGGNRRGDRLLDELDTLESSAHGCVGGCSGLVQLEQRRN